MKPFVALFIAQISSALTYPTAGVRNYGLKILTMMLDHYENECAQYAAKIFPNLYNVFQMRAAGMAPKNLTNLKLAQELSASLLDRYIGILLSKNKFKIPNYQSTDDNSKFFHHTHCNQTRGANDQNEYVWAPGRVLNDIQFSFTAVEARKMHVLHRLIQRKKADESKIILKEDKNNNKSTSSDSTKQKSEQSKEKTTADQGHVLLLSEDVTLYSLESEQSINLFLHKFSKPLIELFLECLAPFSPMIIHHVLHSLYQLLYALEELSPEKLGPDELQEKFSFYKMLKLKAAALADFSDNTVQTSGKCAFIGLMSFFNIEEAGQQLVGLISKNSFGGDVRDLGIALGSFIRIHDYLPKAVQLRIWKAITNIFMNSSPLSDNQKLILQFFTDIVLREQRVTPDAVVFKFWAQQLPKMLSTVDISNIQGSNFLVSALSAFSKSIYQPYLTPESLFPLFTTKFFSALPGSFQTSLLYLLFHSSETVISKDLLKNMSQICTSDDCDNGVSSILVEFISLHKGIQTVDKTTFLLSVVCGKPALVDDIVTAFSNMPDCLDRIASFMNITLKKDLDLSLYAVLLTILNNALKWSKQHNSTNATTSKPVATLVNNTLPPILFKFFKQCFTDNAQRYLSLVINLCTVQMQILDHLLSIIAAAKDEPVVMDMVLILLRHIESSEIKQRKDIWSQISKQLSKLSRDNYTLREKNQQVSSLLVLHKLQ
jgi:hypothetical protein